MSLAASVLLSGLVAWHAQPAWVPSSARRVAQAPLLQYDPATYDSTASGLMPQQAGESGVEGTHGTGYRFMPCFTVNKKESALILCIAGAYPGLTAQQLAAPSVLPFAPQGQWNYHMLNAGAAPGGFVALTSTSLLYDHPDTVVVVCSSSSLGLSFPDGQEHEVLALIDRSDEATFDQYAFDDKAFYALADEQDQVHIRWVKAVPPGWRILGRLLFTQMPFVEKPGRSQGFAEFDDEFEF